jgi:hypothetical protein
MSADIIPNANVYTLQKQGRLVHWSKMIYTAELRTKAPS